MIVNIKAQHLGPDYHIPALDRRLREFCKPISDPYKTQLNGFEQERRQLSMVLKAPPLMFAAGFFMGIATMLFLQT